MVKALHEKVNKIHYRVPSIGYQMLDVITSGMYDDPLMVYREYIQNSVDSIDIAVRQGKLSPSEGHISILVSGESRSICIEDNGAGLPGSLASKVLLDLGCSPKDRTNQRGFRGIGRLGGFGYCELLRFETRCSRTEEVSIIEWDRKLLEDLTRKVEGNRNLSEVVKSITRTFTREPSVRDADHFFRVTMEGVRRFHSDKLMNIRTIRHYLSQVAPVPYDKRNFSYAEKLDKYFRNISGYRSYEITLNGERILRPYSDNIEISTNVDDIIKDIEFFEFLGTDENPLALGWYAKTGFKASFPAHVAMRGIRVRQGNIEVGDERFLSPFFTEGRFATWNIGEIQVWNHNIKPNARRDGFEHSLEYERFLEQAGLLGRRLSTLCRRASSDRSLQLRVKKKLDETKHFLNRLSFSIDEEHHRSLISRLEQDLDSLLPLYINRAGFEGLLLDYRKVKSRLIRLKETPHLFEKHLDGRLLRHVGKKELVQKMLKVVCSEYDKTLSAYGLIQKMLEPFLRPDAKNITKGRH